MPEFGPPDNDVPLPVRRVHRVRRPIAPRYPRDLEAIAHAERRVAEGMTDYSAIMDAIAVVNPSPDMPVAATYARLTSRFRKKHGPRKNREPA